MATRTKRARAQAEPAAVAAEGGVRKKRAAADPRQGSLQEVRAGNGAQFEATEEQEAAIQFWQQFDTALLSSWLGSYSDSPLKGDQLNDRERVVHTLALTEWIGRPKGRTITTQLQQLRQVHRHQMEKNGGLDEPGLYRPEGSGNSSSRQVAFVTHAQANDPFDDDDEEMIDTQRAASDSGGRASGSPLTSPPAARSGKLTLANIRPSMSAGVAPLMGGQGDTPASFAACRSCCRPRPVDSDPSLGFICTGCFRRGDLPTTDPTNIEMRRAYEAEATIRAGKPSSGSGGATALGQSNRDMPTLAHSVSAVDRRHIELTARGGDFDLFVGESAGTPVSHQVALETARAVLFGQAYERPSDQLVQLIRAGKLPAVGWAAPKKNAALTENDTLQLSQLSGGGVGLTSAAKGTITPVACASAQQFAAAMFATILPCLIDKPAAMLQWMALGRTALELEEKYSWAVASDYITQLLGERITRHEGFGKVSNEILTNVTVGVLPRQAKQSAAGSKTVSGGDASGAKCFDFNAGSCPRAPGSCRFAHRCSNCGQDGHPAKTCTRPSTSGGKNPPAAHRARGHGGAVAHVKQPESSPSKSGDKQVKTEAASKD